MNAIIVSSAFIGLTNRLCTGITFMHLQIGVNDKSFADEEDNKWWSYPKYFVLSREEGREVGEIYWMILHQIWDRHLDEKWSQISPPRPRKSNGFWWAQKGITFTEAVHKVQSFHFNQFFNCRLIMMSFHDKSKQLCEKSHFFIPKTFVFS